MRYARHTSVTAYRRAENNRLWFSSFRASAMLLSLLIPTYGFTSTLDSQQGLFARKTSLTSDLRLGHAASTTVPFLRSFVFLGDFKVCQRIGKDWRSAQPLTPLELMVLSLRRQDRPAVPTTRLLEHGSVPLGVFGARCGMWRDPQLVERKSHCFDAALRRH